MQAPIRRWLSSLIICSLLLNLLPPPLVRAQQAGADEGGASALHQNFLPLVQGGMEGEIGAVDPSANLVVLRAGHATTVTACDLYPIALHAQSLTTVAPGTLLANIYNGSQPGNFGWLSWSGDNGVQSLVTSLTPPGSASTYANPNSPVDHKVSIGDWVRGRPGVANAKAVRDALDRLKNLDITVPVWGATQGNGANAQYQITDFALVRLTDCQLPGQKCKRV